jgi:hypothetical protein
LYKKIFWIIITALLLFAGIIAMTEENQDTENPVNTQEIVIPSWVRPLRWYRSNKGGMTLEVMPSQLVALQNEFALSVEFVQRNRLPENLLPYYNDGYFIEYRVLYENSQPVRNQWLFRNVRGTTRVNAAFYEYSEESISKNEIEYNDDNEDNDDDIVINQIEAKQTVKKQKSGFIEIFNESYNLISEYKYFEDGKIIRTDYNYRNGMLISSAVFFWEEGDDEEEGSFKEDYTDFLRYNRSLYLRSVERVFYRDRHLLLADEPVLIAFPRQTMDIDFLKNTIGERLNEYPGFFGDILVEKDSRMVYTTDERSRILSQTLYDYEDNIVWSIFNTWQNDRIVSTVKTEGDTEFSAEYEYNYTGDKVIERNYRNGILERVVRTDGKREIEELIFNDIIIMQAVWEDGRKISETRTGTR